MKFAKYQAVSCSKEIFYSFTKIFCQLLGERMLSSNVNHNHTISIMIYYDKIPEARVLYQAGLEES